MKRWLPAVLALLLLFAAAAAAAEERPVPATPTDLECPHEHTKEYVFYDSTVYLRATSAQHKVIGSHAIIRTVCLDCGEVLSEEEKDQVEELRPHAFKNGKCVFCGLPQPENAETNQPPAPKEHIIALGESAETGDETKAADLLELVLTAEYLEALEAEQTEILVIRPDNCPAAILLPVSAMKKELAEKQAVLRVEIRCEDSGAVYASLQLEPQTAESVTPMFLRTDGIRIRFYPGSRASSIATYIPETGLPAATDMTTENPAGETLAAERTETPAPAQICWEVPYRGPGIYIP